MATNPWVSQSVRSEQNLYEDLVIESLKFYGQDVYYLPREIVNKDRVFLDDVPSRFSDAYKVEMYAENIDGFEGEGDLFSKFGVELRDQATFVVARRRWKKLIGDKLDSYNFRPREGDLIYLPMSKSIFEIFKVETETPFYQLSQLPTFRLQCELFEYNDEDFDTELDGIDDIEVEGAYQYKLIMEDPVTATATATAQIDVDGRVTRIDADSLGRGYSVAPDITVSAALGSNSKFGNASLNVTRGRGAEGSYTQTGVHGLIEFWVYMAGYPNAGTQDILFLTGGSESEPTKQYLWGVNSSGQIVYSRGDNQGGGIVNLFDGNATLSINTWHHIVLLADDTNNLVVYFDEQKIFDSTIAGVTWDWISSGGYAIGAVAARNQDGIQWNSFDGFIDEFRAQVGTRAELLESRYSVEGNDASLNQQTAEYESDSATALLLHFNAENAVATSGISADGEIVSITVDNPGLYYDAPPTVTFARPYTGGTYKRNETIAQDNGTYTIRGEVAKWDSANSTLYLAHVGSTDGTYQTFTTTAQVNGASASYAPNLVDELQKIQQVVDNRSQGSYFDNFEGDFLDFSESNPFGDVS